MKKEDGAPESKCQQGEQDLCLSHSLASVLNVHIPNPNPICHKLIHTQKDRKKANTQSWDHFVNRIKNMVDGHCLMNLNSNNFDPLVDVDRFPKLCVLMGSDGSVNHAVTFLHEWMFDSNVKWAQRTTKEILNWSCMSEHKCIHKGVSIVPQKLAEGLVLPHCWSVPDSVQWQAPKCIVGCLIALFEMLGEESLKDEFMKPMGQKQKGHTHLIQKTLQTDLFHRHAHFDKMKSFNTLCQVGGSMSLMVGRNRVTNESVCFLKIQDLIISSEKHRTGFARMWSFDGYDFTTGLEVKPFLAKKNKQRHPEMVKKIEMLGLM